MVKLSLRDVLGIVVLIVLLLILAWNFGVFPDPFEREKKIQFEMQMEFRPIEPNVEGR